jgi:hypothetical protein
MPSTITAFATFVPNTKAKSSEVNTNFSNFRGNLIPIEESTSTSSNVTHYLGTVEHRWLNTYTKELFLGNTTTSWAIADDTTTVSELSFKVNGSKVLGVDPSGNVIPSTNNSVDVGKPTFRFANFYGVNVKTTNVEFNQTSTSWNAQVTSNRLGIRRGTQEYCAFSTGAFIPSTTLVTELGLESKRWETCFAVDLKIGSTTGSWRIYDETNIGGNFALSLNSTKKFEVNSLGANREYFNAVQMTLSSAINFSTISASYIDVTSVVVASPNTGKVKVYCIPNGNATGSFNTSSDTSTSSIRAYRIQGGITTTVGGIDIKGSLELPCSSFIALDNSLTSGTSTTYTLQMKTAGATAFAISGSHFVVETVE